MKKIIQNPNEDIQKIFIQSEVKYLNASCDSVSDVTDAQL